MPLEYLSDFWRSFERSLINWNIELKLKWTNDSVLYAGGAYNANDRSYDIIFTIKDAKLYLLFVTLLARHNQKLSKRFSKRFER